MRQRWVVAGANEQTGEPVKVTVEAASAGKAEAGMRKRGVLVSSVTPEPLDYATPGDTGEDEQTVHIESVSAGAAFKAGFFGGLGAMAAWIIVWSALGFLLALAGITIGRLLGL